LETLEAQELGGAFFVGSSVEEALGEAGAQGLGSESGGGAQIFEDLGDTAGVEGEGFPADAAGVVAGEEGDLAQQQGAMDGVAAGFEVAGQRGPTGQVEIEKTAIVSADDLVLKVQIATVEGNDLPGAGAGGT
jgi:hypothetical protein